MERGIKWARRRPVTAALVAVIVFGFIAGLLAVGWQWRRAEVARDEADERARGEAEAREKLKVELSYNRIALAEREWQTGNVARADELLADCPSVLRHWEWHYLHRLCHAELLCYRGHAGGVWWASFTPDGKRVLSIGEDGAVRVWDPATGRDLPDRTWTAVRCGRAALSPDGRRLSASAGTADRVIRTWDTATGQDLPVCHGHTLKVACVAITPDGTRLASGSDDRTVRLWDPDTGREVLQLASPTGITGVAFSPDGRRLAATDWGKQLRVWDAGLPPTDGRRP